MKMPSLKVQEYINLYFNGYTATKIAKMLSIKKNTVIASLRYWGIQNPAPGRKIEKYIVDILKYAGFNVEHMPGDHYFDMLFEGFKIDIKSSKLTSTNKSSQYKRYCFEIDHKGSLSNNRKRIDYYLLAFIQKNKIPLYTVKASEVNSKHININETLNSRYNLEYFATVTNPGL